ncbi:MAG: PIN domain-containing protein [Chloroflexota bacterium]
MTAPLFVDTNVLVYHVDDREIEKHRTARGWVTAIWGTGRGQVSCQVLHEFYATVTRKLTRLCPPAQARAMVRDLLGWGPLTPDRFTLDQAWSVQDRFGLSWWDALIVASAQAARCAHLLTEDLQPGQDFGGVVVVNPFLTEPAEVLTA